VAGGVAHVFARGNRQQLIFLDATDRRRYLDLLGRVARRLRWRCLAYCLMDNHVHLLIETRLPNLGRGMRELHGDYAQLFNKRHDRSGHLFQGLDVEQPRRDLSGLRAGLAGSRAPAEPLRRARR
jgi:REP element-mobilizing transposase RayT